MVMRLLIIMASLPTPSLHACQVPSLFRLDILLNQSGQELKRLVEKSPKSPTKQIQHADATSSNIVESNLCYIGLATRLDDKQRLISIKHRLQHLFIKLPVLGRNYK